MASRRSGQDQRNDAQPSNAIWFQDGAGTGERWLNAIATPLVDVPPPQSSVNGGEKVGHWSGGVMLLRAE